MVPPSADTSDDDSDVTGRLDETSSARRAQAGECDESEEAEGETLAPCLPDGVVKHVLQAAATPTSRPGLGDEVTVVVFEGPPQTINLPENSTGWVSLLTGMARGERARFSLPRDLDLGPLPTLCASLSPRLCVKLEVSIGKNEV